MNRVSMAVTAKGKRWETLHSLWIGWTFTFGLFNWIAFIYIGFRAKEWKWVLWGVLYLVPITVVILLLAADASAALGAPAVFLTFGVGVASICHAFWVRGDYLRRLETLRGSDVTAASAIRSSATVSSQERRPNPHRSLWVGWTFVPALNWVAFLYVGIRAKQRKWIFWGMIYLAPWLIPGFNNTTWQWVIGILILVAWIASIAHAFLIRQEYRMRLGTSLGTANEVETAPSGETSDPADVSIPNPDKETPDKPPDREVDIPGLSLPYDDLFRICAAYEGYSYFVGDAIGQKMSANAHRNFPIPDTERIVGLIDTGLIRSGKTGLALCEGGVYWRNDSTTKTYKTYLAWAEFASVPITFRDSPPNTVELGKGNVFYVTKHDIKKEDLSDLFSVVQSLARTYTQEHSPHPASEEPDASSDQPPEVSPSHDVGEQPSAPRDYVRTPASGNHVLLPYEELFSVCAKYEGDQYYVGETIGQKRLTNAHLHFSITDTERIVALIDTSIWANGKSGLALCEGGIYWHNGWSPPAKTYKTSLSWAEFASVTIGFKDKPADIVEFGKGNLFWVQKHQIKKEDLLKLFSEVQSLTRTYVEENQMRDVPSQGSVRSTETPPSTSRQDERGTGRSSEGTHTTAPPPASDGEPDKSYTQLGEASPSTPPEPPLVATSDVPQSAEPDDRMETHPVPANYPLPLAYAYRLADAEFETFRVLKELYRNAEALTAFLASLALSLAPTPTGKRRDTLLRAWRGKGATFGSWYAILEKTPPTIDEDKGHLYRSMQLLLGTKANPSTFAETMTWLMNRRNELHHGDLPVGPRAELLIQEVRRRFELCVSESAALWQHPLRLVLDYDAVRNKNYVIATCLNFSGDHPVGRKVQERYQGIPKKQDLYILQDGEQWISLYPFISVHYCPHCNARETYFIDSWQGHGEEANLRSFERAHEEVSEEIGQELTLRMGS